LGLAASLLCSAAAQPQPSPEAILRHAVELHQAGDIPGAIAEYRAYLKQAPKSVMARSNLGAALSKSGRYEAAIVEYRQALELEPRNLPVRVNLGLALYKTAQIPAAAEELARHSA
jgi:Flp pilus assembly protein TadD